MLLAKARAAAGFGGRFPHGGRQDGWYSIPASVRWGGLGCEEYSTRKVINLNVVGLCATSRVPGALPPSGMGKHPATAGEKLGCSSGRVEAKIKRGSLGKLSRIVPEDTMDVRAKPKLQLCRHWLPGRAGLCRGSGSPVCPAVGAVRGVPAICFALMLSGWKSQGKPADEKFTCKIPSAECLAAGGSAAAPVSCPAGTPRCHFADGLCSTFCFISIFLPAADFAPNAWKHCCESMYRGMLFCRLFWFSFYFLPVTASAGS